jgi:alginate O-acetyltransferase complex protein AlgJ
MFSSPVATGKLTSSAPTVWSSYPPNLGRKQQLIELHNELGYHVIHDLQSDNVLVGRKGWLFLKQDLGWASFRSELPPEEAELRKWRKALAGAQAFLGARGIPLVYVIVPSKESIYPELLPPGAVRARGTTRLDEMLPVLESAHVDYIDLRPELRNAKPAAQIYAKIDSHWNGAGARVGASRILSHVAEVLQRPASFADLDSHLVPRASDGDLALILALQDLETEPSVALVPNQPRAHRIEPPESVLEPTRKHMSRMVWEVPDETLPKALILRDSFAEAFMPTLSEKFRRTTWVWTHELDLQLVNRERPDIVIVELTERFFSGTPPRLLIGSAKRK